MTITEKKDIYRQATAKIEALTSGESDTLLKMASMVAVLKQSFKSFYWIGFYRVQHDTDQLIIGPYQGTPACLKIPFNKGVCGTAAASRTTQVVEDVHAFPGHIACDPLSQSEIVVPIINELDQLIAVLDIDSSDLSTFDQTDKEMLEQLCNTLFSNGTLI